MEPSTNPYTDINERGYSSFANTSKDPAIDEEMMLIKRRFSPLVDEDVDMGYSRFTTVIDGQPFEADITDTTFLFRRPRSIFPRVGQSVIKARPQFGGDQWASGQDASQAQNSASGHGGPSIAPVPFKVIPATLYEYTRQFPSRLVGDVSERYLVPEKSYRLNTKSREFKTLPDTIAHPAMKRINQAETKYKEAYFLEEVYQCKTDSDGYGEQWNFESFCLEEPDSISRESLNEKPLIRHVLNGNYLGKLSVTEAEELVDTYKELKRYRPLKWKE